MATLLTSTDYPTIRAAIDLSLDSTSKSLPDATIALPIYLDAADLELKTRDPLWATRTGDALVQLKNAAIYLTASRIAPTIPRLVGEDFGNYAYKLQSVDWEARAAALRALAEEALNAILDPGDATSDRPTFFATARGYRGRW